MTRLYGILTVVGWTWTLVVAVFIAIRSRSARAPRGFAVMDRRDEE
jgi:hypothetical protein